MKKVLALVMGLLSGGASAVTTHHEASMNFDLENVKPFLEQLNENLNLGLDVDKLVSFTENLSVGEEERLVVTIQFNGESLEMIYQVYMDDIDAPDLYLFPETEEAASALQSEMIEFAQSRGM